MPKMSSEQATPAGRTTLSGPAMGTRWSATVDADNTVDLEALHQALAAAVEQVDGQMSPWKPNSDLMRLNRAPVDTWVELPADMLAVLDCALDIQRLSAGVFDPCVGDLVDAWDRLLSATRDQLKTQDRLLTQTRDQLKTQDQARDREQLQTQEQLHLQSLDQLKLQEQAQLKTRDQLKAQEELHLRLRDELKNR